MIRTDFGASVGRFVESGGSPPLTDSQLTAFKFNANLVTRITQIVASFAQESDTGICPNSRLLVFTGGDVNLGALAREPVTVDLQAAYGITVLLDVIGIRESWQMDFVARPIVSTLGRHLYVLLMPPFAPTDGDYLNALSACTVMGFYESLDKGDVIIPGYENR